MNKKEMKQVSSHSSFFPKNQRGQGLSTNAIILIILGIVVLAVLILGFTIGWSKLLPFLSKDNVETIVNNCDVACSTASTYDYCTKTRELKAEGITVKTNCATFSVISAYALYGIQECPSISCEIPCGTIKVGTKTAEERTAACAATEDDITSIAKFITATNSVCCITK